MSLAETQEIMATLQEIMGLLNGINIRSEKLMDNAPRLTRAASTFHEAERLALRWLAIARRMGLPDQVEQATQVLTQLVVMLRMLQISVGLMTGGGLGALIGLAGIVSVAMTASDMLGYDNMRGNY